MNAEIRRNSVIPEAEELATMKKTCRFCLKDIFGAASLTLFTSQGLNKFLKDKIQKCLNTKLLTNDDHLPNHICLACSKQLDSAYRFTLQFEQSQIKLQSDNAKHLVESEAAIIKCNNNKNEQVIKHECIVQEHRNLYPNILINKSMGNKRKSLTDLINEPLQKTKCAVSDCSIYECQICFCVFKSKNSIHSHMKKHSNKLLNHKELFQNYLNGLCTEEDIQAIISKIISENEVDNSNLGEPFLNQCQLCPAVFASKAHLSKHIQRHCESDNSIKYTALKRCGKKNLIVPKKEISLIRDEVEAGCINSLGLNQDDKENNQLLSVKNFDTREKVFVSTKNCDDDFKNHCPPESGHRPEKAVNMVMNKSEKHKNIFQCSDCNEVFFSKANIRKHVVGHLK